MSKRIGIVLAITAATSMWMVGCDRQEEPQQQHKKVEVTTQVDPMTVAPPPKPAAPKVAWRQLMGRAQIYMQRPAVREQQYATVVLDAGTYRDKAIVGSRVELSSMKDSKGNSYINEFQDWSNSGGYSSRQTETYGLPQMEIYRNSSRWGGLVRANLAGLNRMPLDVATMTGELRLLEASEVQIADIKINDGSWQKVVDGIEIQIQKVASRPGYSSENYAYSLRSGDGLSFMSMGGTPCVLGMVAMRANGESQVYYGGSSNMMSGGNRTGNLSLGESTSVLRLFIATKFEEHVLPFSFEKMTAQATAAGTQTQTTTQATTPTANTTVATATGAGDGAKIEEADEATSKALDVRMYEINFASTVDQSMDKPMIELTLRGYATLDRNSPVMCLGVPVIDKITDSDGSTIELPATGGAFEPMRDMGYSGSSETGKMRYSIGGSRTDLPRLPKQAQQLIGHMTVVKAGETEAKAFEKLEQNQKIDLLGGATMRITNQPSLSGNQCSFYLEFMGPYRATTPNPGEPGVVDIRVVDDQGAEVSPSSPLRINSNMYRTNEYRDSFGVSYRLEAGRKAVGLRVYCCAKTSAMNVPFTVDLTQPITSDPSSF